MPTLDPDAVQTFVLVADLASFTRAAEALGTTQSAISLRIKRLEESLGHRLFERTPRLVRLSADGCRFLEPARALIAAHQGALAAFGGTTRRLTVGISHHIVGPELPVLLQRLAHAEPSLVLELRVATSRDTLEAFEAGALDAALVLQPETSRRDGVPISREPFAWIGTPDFVHAAGTPLRLATQSAPCSVRTMAISALDAAGVPWTEVFVGGGVATIGAAVSAGLAVAALARRVAPAGTVDVGPRLGLPPLPARDVVLHAAATDAQARAALRSLTAALRATGSAEIRSAA